MSEPESIRDIRIPINAETLKSLAPMWRMTIHGDYFDRDWERHAWDLEFPDMHHATSFAATMADDFHSIDIRRRDRIDSIHKPVTLTVIELEPRK